MLSIWSRSFLLLKKMNKSLYCQLIIWDQLIRSSWYKVDFIFLVSLDAGYSIPQLCIRLKIAFEGKTSLIICTVISNRDVMCTWNEIPWLNDYQIVRIYYNLKKSDSLHVDSVCYGHFSYSLPISDWHRQP